MNRADTIITTTIDRWLLPHIAGILEYADQNQTFGFTLATWLDEENWSMTPIPTIEPSQHLFPVSATHADDIVDWLMHELATHPEARIARSTMMTWASNYQVPEDFIVMGLAGTMVPGLTIGDPKIKKKEKSKLQIVVDETWQNKLNATELVEATHELSQNLIALELRKAGGKIGSLHPDTAEWSMGGAATKLYPCDTKQLNDIFNVVTEQNLHHYIHDEEGIVYAVAISPSVNDSLIEELF